MQEADEVLIDALLREFRDPDDYTALNLEQMMKLSVYLHADFIRLLINPDWWPVQDLEKIQAKEFDAGLLKDFFVKIITQQIDRDINLLVNAALQSLCKQTLLGGIFYKQRVF